MNGLLNGKRIVVTGAARGLGYHFAEACAAQGATVVMCDILQGELAEKCSSPAAEGLSGRISRHRSCQSSIDRAGLQRHRRAGVYRWLSQ